MHSSSLRGDQVIDAILKFLTLGSLVTGVAAIYFAVLNNNRRLGAQIFLTYTDRIFNVRRSLSAGSYLRRLDGSKGDLTVEEQRAVHEAFYLIFEFHALRRHRYVAKNIWQICEPDMERLLNSAAVESEWMSLCREFELHPEFLAWAAQKRASGASRHPV